MIYSEESHWQLATSRGVGLVWGDEIPFGNLVNGFECLLHVGTLLGMQGYLTVQSASRRFQRFSIITQSVQRRYFWTGGSPGWLVPCGDSGIQASSIAGFEVPGSRGPLFQPWNRERESMEAGARISWTTCGRAKLLGRSVPASGVPGTAKDGH